MKNYIESMRGGMPSSKGRIASSLLTYVLVVVRDAMTYTMGILPVLIFISSTAFAQREYKSITGILGAFDAEVEYLVSITTNKKEKIIQQIHFTEGEVNGKKVVIAQTGIGKVNAAVVTILMIEHFAPRELIFTGIAGGVNPDLSPGDIVIGSRVSYHDYGMLTADSLWRKPTKDPFMNKENPIFYKCDSSLVEKALKAAVNTRFGNMRASGGERHPRVIKGTIVTGDVFVASNRVVKELRKNLHADVTEMEGAAVAQTCYQWKQPFIVIRSLSDNADDLSAGDVKLFYKMAAQNSANLVVSMLKFL
jgi:adenosylhomocysteine nucleosidase